MAEEGYGAAYGIGRLVPSSWDDVRGLFSTGSEYKSMAAEDFLYERKLFDKRIEVFLDRHFAEFIRDFGILDEIALEVRNERLLTIEEKSEGLISFTRSIDNEASSLENRVATLEKALKRKKK